VTLLKMVILLPLMAVGGKQRAILRRQQDLYRALRYEIDTPSTRKE